MISKKTMVAIGIIELLIGGLYGSIQYRKGFIDGHNTAMLGVFTTIKETALKM